MRFLGHVRRFTSHFELVELPIFVHPADLNRAISAYQSGTMDDTTLMRWATMLVLNDAYLWDENDEPTADALHELSTSGFRGREKLRESAGG